jgi:hypothetical protein
MNSTDEATWQSLLEGLEATSEAYRAFLRDGTDRIGVLRRGLAGGAVESLSALDLLPYLDDSEQLQTLDGLINLCLQIRYAARARQIVAAMPRECVLSHLRNVIDPLGQDADHIDFQMLMELYRCLDKDLAATLARRAAAHADTDIREFGESFLRRLL